MQLLSGAGLNLAISKSEAIEFTNKRRHNDLTIVLNGSKIVAHPHLRYLGIELDQKLRYKEHARIAATKADNIVKNLSKILPNLSAA